MEKWILIMICLTDEELKEIEEKGDWKTIFADVVLWKRPMDKKLFLLVGKFISSEKFTVSYAVPEDEIADFLNRYDKVELNIVKETGNKLCLQLFQWVL